MYMSWPAIKDAYREPLHVAALIMHRSWAGLRQEQLRRLELNIDPARRTQGPAADLARHHPFRGRLCLSGRALLAGPLTAVRRGGHFLHGLDGAFSTLC